PEGTSYANAANPACMVVCKSVDPPNPDFNSAVVLEGLRVPGVLAEQLFYRRRLWRDRRLCRRNWLDGLRFSRTIPTAFRAFRCDSDRVALGNLAPASD